MKLAPRMIQSMEILQLPALALLEKIEAELNTNPVLEQAEPDDETQSQTQLDTPVETPDESSETADSDDANKPEEFQRLESVDEGFVDYLSRASSFRTSRYDSEPDKKIEAMQNTAAKGQSLHEFLTEQWRLVDAGNKTKKAGQLIIDYIDERGYLQVRLEQLHNKDKHDFTLEHLTEALKLIQQLEPAGIGARDLVECLLIQIDQSETDMSFEKRLVSEYMPKLLENQLPWIAKKMNCSLDRINQAIANMRKFDTSPGLQITKDKNHPVTVDVIVDLDDNDGFSVRLADMTIPPLRINHFYKKMSRDRNLDGKTKEFLQNNIRSAHWLMDAIEQRKQTLLRVSRSIVKHQLEFFKKGQLHLKPLPMATIADDVGVHLATVSRAVADKYVQCPQGILPLRGFFSGGLETTDGQSQSFDVVRTMLQQIVDSEDKSKPLNDDQIREKLENMGIKKIARRTIAKYRKLLNVPTARFRKKY